MFHVTIYRGEQCFSVPLPRSPLHPPSPQTERGRERAHRYEEATHAKGQRASHFQSLENSQPLGLARSLGLASSTWHQRRLSPLPGRPVAKSWNEGTPPGPFSETEESYWMGKAAGPNPGPEGRSLTQPRPWQVCCASQCHRF